ncbi:MAG: hypothetical protein HY293_22965 [Planctomycetes bacterium]|nr:hypothetical protein [Planctomycetota bacterium]
MSAALLLAAGSRAPAAPQAGSLLINDPFITMPVWDDVYNAPWNTNAGQISWSIEPTGGAPDSTGNTSYLRVLRNEAGSSVVVKQYTVPQNTDIYVGTWMRCPSTYSPAPGENYWMEASFKIGAWGGQNFDDPATGASWFPLLMKFSYTGGNPLGNNNIWTWYVSSAPKNSGASTTVSVAYKVGSLYDTVTYAQPPPGPDIGYDGIYVSDTPMVSPPAPPPPVPPSPPPPGGGTPPATGAARQKDNKPCGCSTAGVPGSGSAWLALLLSAALLTIRRR